MCCLKKCSRFSSVKFSLSSIGVLHSSSLKSQTLKIGENDKKISKIISIRCLSINHSRNNSLLSGQTVIMMFAF